MELETEKEIIKKTAAIKPNFTASADRSVVLLFRENRSFELHVGRLLVRFDPKGEQTVPAWVIDHSDFENVSKYFVVKEVK